VSGDPIGQLFLGYFPGRDALKGICGISFICHKLALIHLQENVDDGECDALIAVGKAMVSRKRIAIGCSESLKRWRWSPIAKLLLRPAKCRF